ncbi:hypothetical protein VPNG_04018 [Cytospora leucostoma]|uniref:Ecp2 effector protein-like domain-containing protein n=1 Tax=Cytospora leucostoma TaxID=1230097 RepID=A0A423XD34_9PEZI|nr:hypothetical protein VPNG_04018 [Cytospora leucostoma]
MKLLTSIFIACGLLSSCLAATVRFTPSNSSVSVLQERAAGTDAVFHQDQVPHIECNAYTMMSTTPDNTISRNDCMVVINSIPHGYWDVFNWEDDETYEPILGYHTCTFCVSRNDGVKNHVYIGDRDVYYFVSHALDGDRDPLPTFMGSMQCLTDDPNNRGDIAWLIRSVPR